MLVPLVEEVAVVVVEVEVEVAHTSRLPQARVP
jgi:hypothetical protein